MTSCQTLTVNAGCQIIEIGTEPVLPSGVVTSATVGTIVSLTQAEYDAIVTPDPATLYVIVG